MIPSPPRSTRTDTLFPYTTLFRSRHAEASPCRNVGCVDWSRGDREVCRSSVYLLILESRPKPGCRDKSRRLGAVRFLALIRIEIALTQTDRLRRSAERRDGKECVSTCRSRG